MLHDLSRYLASRVRAALELGAGPHEVSLDELRAADVALAELLVKMRAHLRRDPLVVVDDKVRVK